MYGVRARGRVGRGYLLLSQATAANTGKSAVKLLVTKLEAQMSLLYNGQINIDQAYADGVSVAHGTHLDICSRWL